VLAKRRGGAEKERKEKNQKFPSLWRFLSYFSKKKAKGRTAKKKGKSSGQLRLDLSKRLPGPEAKEGDGYHVGQRAGKVTNYRNNLFDRKSSRRQRVRKKREKSLRHDLVL